VQCSKLVCIEAKYFSQYFPEFSVVERETEKERKREREKERKREREKERKRVHQRECLPYGRKRARRRYGHSRKQSCGSTSL
jgi:hypothetical protein